ncbi:unnamed protein product [Lymnaea stagnalis]|uniref:39S ribosomal protein L34, mitochondrial n=1 Tax=Lymnaea stagnalis TaxID=6523 RepID=A0AAV2I3U5_LYMST
MALLSQLRNIWSTVSLHTFSKQKCLNHRIRDSVVRSQHSVSLFHNPLTQKVLQHNFTPTLGTCPTIGKKLASPVSVTHQSVRSTKNYGVRVYYKGSAWKRYNKHNIERRLTTPGGLEILWRKVLKGRHQLAAYERILPNTVNGKILPEHLFRFKDHPLTKKRLPKPGLF